jgi:hypothetical protein
MAAEVTEAGSGRGAGWWQRFAGEVETVGAARLPERQRTMTPLKVFIVWAMASALATTPLITPPSSSASSGRLR